MANLDRDAPIPLYHQIKRVILSEIESGRWKFDQQLPTEDELSARFEVSKITVRQALRELSNLGYVRREQGRGTFVQRPKLEEGPRELTSFTEEMGRHGLVATSRVLDQGSVLAREEVASALGIRTGDPVFRLRRLRLADKEPMGIQTAYVAMAAVPGIDQVRFDDGSLYELLRSRYSLYPVRARETHVAVLVGGEEASLLGLAPGSPALAAERVTYGSDGRPLEYVSSIMRGDRYKIVLELANQPSAR
jgi:GntR family transcriptional regulator